MPRGVDTAIAAIASRRAAGQSEAAIIEAMAAGEIPGQDDGSLDFAWLSFFDRLDRLEEPALRTLLKRANNLPDDLQSIAEAYQTAARWLNLAPAQILMVACHNFDLNAAHKAGFRTAFVRRPDEWGPEGPPDPNPNTAYDFIEDNFDALRQRVLSRS